MGLNFSQLGQRQQESDIVRLMSVAIQQPDLLSLAAGFTDNSTLPLADVKSLVSGLDESSAQSKSVLQYGTNQGSLKLRQLLTRRIESYDGVAEGRYDVDRMLISNGSQQGLYLAMLTLCDPGDIVLVEQPTYFVFLEILKGLGVEAMAMPMSSGGDVDVEALSVLIDELASQGRLARLKALYLVSYFANPSGHSINFSVKEAIAGLLKSKASKVALIEDAAYRDLYYEVPFEGGSLLRGEAFDGLSVIYSSTLTKPFASGLKLGYSYCSDTQWLAKMLSVKGQQDFGTANFNQVLMETAIESGMFDQHLSRIRIAYAEKMEILHNALLGPLQELGWTWSVPGGGLYLWLKAPRGLRTDFDSDLHRLSIDEGVLYVPGDLCHGNGVPRDCVRLSYGVLEQEKLGLAAERFVNAARKITPVDCV